MRKKILKAELASSNEMRVQSHIENMDLRKRNMAIAKELGDLKAEKRNRELADKIAVALGSGWVGATSVTFNVEAGGYVSATIDMTGDYATLYAFCTVLRGE